MRSFIPRVSRPVFFQLLLPTFFVHLTRGLTVSTLPLIVLENLQQSKFSVGLAVSSIGLGKILSDIPLGVVLSYIGARNLMMISGLIITGSAFLSWVSVSVIGSFWCLVVALLVYGVGQGAGVLSRLAMISENIPKPERGQISALLGGSARLAMAVGPALGGILMDVSLPLLFLIQAMSAVCSVLVLFLAVSSHPMSQINPESPRNIQHSWRSFYPSQPSFPAHILLNIGVFVVGIQLVRECRKLVIPLAGVDLGMSIEDVGWYSTVSYSIDALLFSTAGIVMDTYGRNFCATASVSIMVLAQLIILPGVSETTLFLNAVIGGIGNGLSSGILVAYGADLAPFEPPEAKSEFLGYYRLIGDFGEFFGPMIVGTLAQFTSTPTMINTVCSVGIASVYWLVWKVPEPLSVAEEPPKIPSPKPLASQIKQDDQFVQ